MIEAISLLTTASKTREHLIIILDITIIKGLLVDKNTKYFATLDSSLLTLYSTIRPINNVRKV